MGSILVDLNPVLKQKTIRHRGHSDVQRENTIHGISMAYVQGYPWVEVDVRACRDELVLLHDENLKRTIGIDRKLSDCFYQEIQNYLPSLATALSISGLSFNLELKEPGLLDRAVGVVSCFDREIVFTSFDRENLVGKPHPYPVGLIYHPGQKIDYQFGDVMVVEHTMLEFLDWEQVKMPVWCYTVPGTEDEIVRCLMNGATKVIID